MTRSLTVTWEDPIAAFEEGRNLAKPIGVVHSGIAFTMLDSAMGCSVQTGPIRAIGKIVHMGRQTATAEGRLEDAAGKLYAHATTTCIIL